MGYSQEGAGDKSPDYEPFVVRRFIAVPDRLLGPDWPWVVAILIIALLAAWPAVLQPGLLNTRGGGDSPFLLQRLHQLTAALADGHFPVRWMPDANYGYGYPFYNYYAPLSIYVAAAFRFLGFSFVRSIHVAQLAGFVVAGLGTFYLGRRWLGSPWAGLLAAVAYTLAPFHMVNVYVRGDSLAEFWAMAFYPLVLLAADRLIKATTDRGRRTVHSRPSTATFRVARPLALFAVTYAALILSHNISALIFSPFLLLYMVMRLLTKSGSKRDWKLETLGESSNLLTSQSPSLAPPLFSLAALLLAFALAAWFFVPALAEQDLAQLSPVTEGYFHYSNHFRGLDLVGGGLIFDYDADGGRAFRMGLVQAALSIAGAVAMLYAWRSAVGRRVPTTDRVIFLLLGMLIATLMVTPLSRPLWDHLPLLPFTQFPWRLLSVASFMAALLTGALVLVTKRPAVRAAIAILGSLVLLASGLLGLKTDHLILTDADVTAERLAQYEWFTGNIGTTVSAEYLTPESSPRPWTSAWLNTGDRDRVVAVDGELLSARLIERWATRQDWALDVGRLDTTVLFPTMNWPNWVQSLDGDGPYNYSTSADTQPGSGLTSTPLDNGEQTLYLTLNRTPIRIAAELLSFWAVLMIAMLLVIGGRPSAADVTRAVAALGIVAVGILLLAFFWRDDPRELSPSDLTWDFAQMAYLHHDPGGVGFTDGFRLHQYSYSADEIAAGETLTITLSIAPGEGRSATLDLVTPASARPTPDGAADPPVIAAATLPLDGESVVFTLSVSPDAPPGLYVPRLTLDGARPLMPSGGARGDLFLRPVRIATGDDRPATGSQQLTTDDPLDVHAVSLTMRDANTLDGRFAWYTERALGARYQFSWRVQDAAGNILAQLDAQPGYGYQPSTVWPPGHWTADWLALRLSDTAPTEGEYPLVMRLYDVETGEVVLTRRVGVLSWAGGAWRPRQHEPIFALPEGLTPMEATFGRAAKPFIALRGYRLERETDALRLTLYWEALADVPYDYTHFVHLIDPAGGNAAQIDGAPVGNSYPTGQWTVGEIVADTVTFDLANLEPGEYRLATGFYQPREDLPRVSALSPDGLLPDGRALLPDRIIVP